VFKQTNWWLAAAVAAGLLGCRNSRPLGAARIPVSVRVVDPKANYATKAVFYNLRQAAGKTILFGQQDATQYGIGWHDQTDRSDVKSVCGSHPALYGWDVAEVVNARRRGRPATDSVLRRHRQLVVDVYQRGGLNTFCWHMNNYMTGGNFYDTTATVAAILPGGAQHAAFRRDLDVIADFFRHLRAPNGRTIPVIFRPFHEHTGSWFWWGKRHCTRAEFVQLWQFTVHYLRDEQKVRNLLFAYSPDRVPNMREYFERYPGDDFVDVLGFDDYGDFNTISATPNRGVATLDSIVAEARQRGKIAALTEAGLEKVTAPNWFNDNLLGQLKAHPQARQIAYLMVWRNARLNHFYAPYPGHASVPGFLQFYADSVTTFESDHPRLYTVPRRRGHSGELN